MDTTPKPYPPTVEHNGETYYLQSSGRYYASGNRKAPERLLHRRIWYDAFGPIPHGHHVHHKNENWRDNSLDNLTTMPGSDHLKMHFGQRKNNPEYAAHMRKNMVKAQAAAAEWHGSPEGRAWHSVHAREGWATREQTDCVCIACQSVFKAWMSDAQYCSLSCRQRLSFQRHKTATGVCVECGAPFKYNKYRTQECCSRLCSNRRRGRLGKA